jgi:hypothetical protein
MRLREIQEQIGRGQYHVDAQAVADAILRRLLQQNKGGGSESSGAHGECS